MVIPIWISVKQETVSGSGISWAVCKSAPHCRQITMPAPNHSVFTGRMPFLPPNQQCQSAEGTVVVVDATDVHTCTVYCNSCPLLPQYACVCLHTSGAKPRPYRACILVTVPADLSRWTPSGWRRLLRSRPRWDAVASCRVTRARVSWKSWSWPVVWSTVPHCRHLTVNRRRHRRHPALQTRRLSPCDRVITTAHTAAAAVLIMCIYKHCLPVTVGHFISCWDQVLDSSQRPQFKSSSLRLSLLSLPGPSASEVTTLWRCTNLFIIIIKTVIFWTRFQTEHTISVASMDNLLRY